METVLTAGCMAESIKATSKQIYFMERELKSGEMAKFTQVTGKKINKMDVAHSNTRTAMIM
jgi:hypothetical protein